MSQSSMLWPLLSDEHCGAQGTGEPAASRYPQHRAIARDECILDSLPPASVSRFSGRYWGPPGNRASGLLIPFDCELLVLLGGTGTGLLTLISRCNKLEGILT